jgi:hypothetical protein
MSLKDMSRNSRLFLFMIAGMILLVLIGSVLIATYILFLLDPDIVKAPVINNLIPVESGRYSIGQNFSVAETDKLIEIASTDPLITGATWFESRDRLPDDMNVERVSADKYLERTPDRIPGHSLFVPRYRVLPVVIFNKGDPAYEGIDTYVYVDPDRGYVPYIGYVFRQGLKGEDGFSILNDGVKKDDYEKGWLFSSIWFENESIAYTAYLSPKKMTDEQKADLLGIALNDSRVKRSMAGYEYEAGDFISDSLVRTGSGGGYYMIYPGIEFLVKYRGEWVPLMKVDVDLAGRRVVAIKPLYSEPSMSVRPYYLV